MANTESQKPLYTGKPSPSLSLCPFKLPPHSCEQLGEKEDGQHTCVGTIQSRHAVPGEAEPAELRLEQSPGCCNQTQSFIIGFLATPAPADLSCSRDSDPKCPAIPKVFLHLKSFRSHFPPLTLSCRMSCSPGQRSVFATQELLFLSSNTTKETYILL